MHLRVHEVKVVIQRKRYDEKIVKYAECIVGDKYGCVNFWAKHIPAQEGEERTKNEQDKMEQLNIIKEGAIITIRNAHAKVYNEHLRLEVDKWAKLEECKNV